MTINISPMRIIAVLVHSRTNTMVLFLITVVSLVQMTIHHAIWFVELRVNTLSRTLYALLDLFSTMYANASWTINYDALCLFVIRSASCARHARCFCRQSRSSLVVPQIRFYLKYASVAIFLSINRPSNTAYSSQDHLIGPKTPN